MRRGKGNPKELGFLADSEARDQFGEAEARGCRTEI